MAVFDPVNGVDWGTKLDGHSFTYYLYQNGQTVGDPNIANVDDPSVPDATYTAVGWNNYEAGELRAALATYSAVADVTFTPTNSFSGSTLRMMLSNIDSGTLGFFIPPGGGTASGFGAFNVNGATWSRTQAGGTLEPGGDGFNTIVHELGHALGLKHPHDNGGGNGAIFPGVTTDQDLGTYDLNQSINTVMSYVSGWPAGPDGVASSELYGRAMTPMAFDVAALQAKYGANNNYRTGNDTYTLPGQDGVGTGYACIWDAGGTNTIAYGGAGDAVINLNPASLAFAPNGGGSVSYVKGVHGGFTIAHGVTIQNAISGSGNDLLVGNNTGDYLNPGAGNNTVFGGAGADTIQSTTGNDDIFTGAGEAKVWLGNGLSTVVSGSGDTTVNAGTGASTVFGGSGAQAKSAVFGGGGRLLFVGGSDASTVIGGSGGADIFTGNSSGTFYGGKAGGELLCAGTGAVTLVGGGSGDQLFSSDRGGNVLVAGTGNETLVGSASHAGDLVFTGAAGTRDSVWMGYGADTLCAGGGTAMISGGGGADVYLFAAGKAGGTDVFYDFKAGEDHIVLQGYGSGAANAAIASAKVAGGSTTFALSDNTRVTLVNVGALQRSFFV